MPSMPAGRLCHMRSPLPASGYECKEINGGFMVAHEEVRL